MEIRISRIPQELRELAITCEDELLKVNCCYNSLDLYHFQSFMFFLKFISCYHSILKQSRKGRNLFSTVILLSRGKAKIAEPTILPTPATITDYKLSLVHMLPTPSTRALPSVGIMLPYLSWGKLRTKLERGLLVCKGRIRNQIRICYILYFPKRIVLKCLMILTK